MKQISTYLMLAVLALAGCGGAAYKYDAVVTGRVTVDGELAKSGTVTFHPVSGGKIAIGRINADGSYSLRTGQGDLREVDGGTVVPGAYIVTVSITGPPVPSVIEGAPPSAGPSLVASKYAMHDTSDLKRTVKSGPQVINLELDAAETPPPAEESDESAVEQPAEETQESTDASPVEKPADAQGVEATPEVTPETTEPATDESVETPTQ